MGWETCQAWQVSEKGHPPYSQGLTSLCLVVSDYCLTDVRFRYTEPVISYSFINIFACWSWAATQALEEGGVGARQTWQTLWGSGDSQTLAAQEHSPFWERRNVAVWALRKSEKSSQKGVWWVSRSSLVWWWQEQNVAMDWTSRTKDSSWEITGSELQGLKRLIWLG